MIALSSTWCIEINVKLHLFPLNPSPLSIGISGHAIFSNENFVHNSHSVNIFERMTEGKFCKCCLHLSISKPWGKALISRNTSDLVHVAFHPGPSQLSGMQMEGLVMKISCPASWHCPIRNHSWHRKTGTYFTPETCVASVRKTWMLPWKLGFHLKIQVKNAHWWVVSTCYSSVNIKLDLLELMGWTDLVKCYASCVFHLHWKQILRITPTLAYTGIYQPLTLQIRKPWHMR